MWEDQLIEEKMASFLHPCGIFVTNGEVYIADMFNHRVRKLLRNGQIVTICGTGIQGYNGDVQLATNAQLDQPSSVLVSPSDQVYISERNRIRKIDRNGIISTICGTGDNGYNGDNQLAIHAQIYNPRGLFVTEDEEVLFADNHFQRVRKIDRHGIIRTIAGTGHVGSNGDGRLAISASLKVPTSVFQYKNEIYIADNGVGNIRKINRNGIISTIAGYGEGSIYPHSIFVHNDDVYFTDNRHLICKILPNGMIKTIAGIENDGGFNGDDQLATQCTLNLTRGIFIDNDSQIYFADANNHCVRKIDQSGMMRRVVGKGDEYSGDVPFDFQQYPHIGPRKKPLIKPFPRAYHDLIVICEPVVHHRH